MHAIWNAMIGQEMSDAIEYLKHELKISKEAKSCGQLFNRGGTIMA